MTNRQYSEIVNNDTEARRLVDEISRPNLGVDNYRATMLKLGEKLGENVVKKLSVPNSNDACVVCTVEDADFLAKGVVNTLDMAGMGGRTKLLCIWNERVKESGVSIAPITKQYMEKSTSSKVDYIIVKSIISSACIVKTNLTRALSDNNHGKIIIVSPVLLYGAQQRLEQEFPEEIANLFEYIWFATDFEKSGDYIYPGIGGSVYENLGFVDEKEKNKYTPNIVRQRRSSRFNLPVCA